MTKLRAGWNSPWSAVCGLVAMASLAGLVAGTPIATAQTLSTLHIATPGNDGNAMAWYAQDTGIYKKYGIDAQVEAIRKGSGAAIAAAVAGGAADIGEGDIVAIAAAREHGIPLVALAPSFRYRGTQPIAALVVAKNSPIASAKDFEGKVVGAPSLEGPAKMAVYRWLQRNGADATLVKFVEMAPNTAAAAVANGTITGDLVNEPFLTPALDTTREFSRPYDTYGKETQVSAWFAREDWVKANPDLVQRFVKAMHETALWANTPANYPKSGAILQKYDGFPTDLIQKMRRAYYGDAFSLSLMQPLLDDAVLQKSIPTHIDAKDMISAYSLVQK